MATAGALADDWRSAFEAVPRHVFVPAYRQPDGGVISGADPGTRDQWTAAVYSDEPLTTQVAAVDNSARWWPTSSSSRPSLMARMLHLLDARQGHKILEIGTGTGYNAALLCHRLGAASLASIDIDPALVDAARTRLARLGWHPYIAVADGARGLASRAPYDRILATCAVATVPPAWITQLSPGGLIVADLRGELSSNLVVLRRTDPYTVTGRFLAEPGHFMWLRPEADNPFAPNELGPDVLDLDGAAHRRSPCDPRDLDGPDARFVVQLGEPTLRPLSYALAEDGSLSSLHLRTSDASWAEVGMRADDVGRYPVVEGGPRRLWQQVERSLARWQAFGRPRRDRFGITATVAGHQHHWLDHPDNAI